MTMTTSDAPRSDLSIAARWRQNRLDVEAGRPPTHALTPAQVDSAKSTVGFPRGNGEARPLPALVDPWRRRFVMPFGSYVEIAPGESTVVQSSSMYSWFPVRALFSQRSLDAFEVEEVSLRQGSESPIVLRSRDRGRIDVQAIDLVVERVVVPPGAELFFRVRNVDDVPRVLSCAILCFFSALECREADLSQEEARRIDAALMRCADGSTRRTLQELRSSPGEPG